MSAWLIPACIYVVAVGAVGVTSKLALRVLPWQELIMWSGIGYVVVCVVLLWWGEAQLRVVDGTGWAVLTAGLAIGSLAALYLALADGEASKVVPISASYPAVTLLLSAAFLAESVSLLRWVGMALVVTGVVLLTVTR